MKTVQELIDEYGNQAYHVTVKLVVAATVVNDTVGADHYAECAKQLMVLGYHKKGG